jgi:hypothetical protein
MLFPKQIRTLLWALVVMGLFTTGLTAQISGLCNTGQTRATIVGCTGVVAR